MTIPWDKIWEWHAPNFKDGLANIVLGPDISFPLRPGPGFGDGSHPTTRLMLSLMSGLVKDKIIVDVGSGTGILSIASLLLGAKAVYAFEIDEDAIFHAKENFRLNQVHVFMNQIPTKFDLVLMNMISSEQRAALEQYPFLRERPSLFLTSGILAEEEEAYLANRKCLSKAYLDGWLATVFAF